jgi:hypothetical protein
MTRDLFEVFDEAVQLASSVEDNFLQLARRLRKLQDHNSNLFKGVCSQTGLGRRKAFYLAKIARQIEDLAIPDPQLAAIGWTKVEAIGKHLTKVNWQNLLALAHEHSVHDLKIVMKGGRPIPGTRCVLLYLKPSHYALFANAIVKHGGRIKGVGLAGKERALLALIEKAAAP